MALLRHIFRRMNIGIYHLLVLVATAVHVAYYYLYMY